MAYTVFIMLLSGFTFIRNAIKFDFPIRECVESMLPIVDELVINVGRSEDGTEELIEKLARDAGAGKIKRIHNVWDDSKTRDGLILSEQTNLALDACAGRWALYLQADEALHENELQGIRRAVEEADLGPANGQPEGFRFRYLHFYGGYTLVQRPWNWYPSEIRVVRRSAGARSHGDAQTFRGPGGRKLRTQLLDAHVFHYGHARAPETMLRKINYFHRFWHGDAHGKDASRAYKLDMKNLVWYWGAHPKVYEPLARKAAAWSPTPKKLAMPARPDVVVFYREKDPAQRQLAEELIRSFSLRSLSAVAICGWGDWLQRVSSRWVSRRRSAVIDLDAESRGLFFFLFWIAGAGAAFAARIAHSPRGELSKFRKFFYSAIHWTSHENAAEGFRVPPARWAAQILSWLGLDF